MCIVYGVWQYVWYVASGFVSVVRLNNKFPKCRRQTYFDIYAEHLARKPRTTSTLFKALVNAATIQVQTLLSPTVLKKIAFMNQP